MANKLESGTRIGKCTKMHGDTKDAKPMNKGKSRTGVGVKKPQAK